LRGRFVFSGYTSLTRQSAGSVNIDREGRGEAMRPQLVRQVLETSIRAKQNMMLVGAPGCGKTDLAHQASNGIADLLLFHPVVSDPTDFKGYPTLKVDTGKGEFIPFSDLYSLIKADRPTVAFFDDLGQAMPSVQAAVMQLILGGAVGSHKVNLDHVVFWAATNRREDMAGVQGILEPVKSRFISIVQVEQNIEDWTKWALSIGHVEPDVVGFLNFKPEYLTKFEPTKAMTNSPSARTITHLSDIIQAGYPGEALFDLFVGAAGEAAATEFMAFRRDYKRLPDIDLILLEPKSAPVPAIQEPALLYAVCGALSARVDLRNFDKAIQYVERLPAEFTVLAMKMIVGKNGPNVQNNRAFIEWASRNQEVLFDG